jgi:YfiH family protein
VWGREGHWVRLSQWERDFGVVAAVSTRPLRDMKDVANFERRLGEIGLNAARWAGGQQVHGCRVVSVARPRIKEKKRTDGLITRSPGLTLRVFTADCVPVFLVDPFQRAVGLVHAGWRGARHLIVTAAIQRLARQYGTRPADVRVAFGPHIGVCCCAVGPDVASFFQGTRGAVSGFRGSEGSQTLNLSAVLSAQILAVGVRRKNIVQSPGCTVCTNDYFSFRRDKTVRRQAAVVCITRARVNKIFRTMEP